MKIRKTIGIVLAVSLLCGQTACSQNEMKEYWKEKVEGCLFGQQYVNLRVVVDEYSVFNGVEFDIMPTDTIDIHVTPQGLYMKNKFVYKLVTKDSIFAYHFQEGNYTYGRTRGVKTKIGKLIRDQLYDRQHKYLDDLLPFYLKPNKKSSFMLRKFSRMELIGGSMVMWYTTQPAWKEYFPDGQPIKCSENHVVWIDDISGLVTRVRRTIHKTSNGIDPSDDIYDLRIIDVNFDKPTIDESLYRKKHTVDSNVAFYNLNNDECSPSLVGSYVDENLDGFQKAPLVNASYDTTALQNFEGWVLVNFWTFGCKPCVQFAKQLQHEQTTLGYRKLEKEGIKLVCLNPISTITESFISYVKQYQMSDITYSAKSVADHINWKGYPYYILISPKKEIVFQGSYLGENYKNILEAKKNYTQRTCIGDGAPCYSPPPLKGYGADAPPDGFRKKITQLSDR